MNQQTSFAESEDARKKKTTRREKFLAQMEMVVPWARLVEVIVPHYPTGQRGCPPVGIERMLRLYFLQQGDALADEALEDALYDSQAPCAALPASIAAARPCRTRRRCSSSATGSSGTI